jgi:hypothetical protein
VASQRRAISHEVISTKIGAKKCYGVLEIRPAKNGVTFVIHYGRHSQSDGRTWGNDQEERRNMIVMAEALLLQIAHDPQSN